MFLPCCCLPFLALLHRYFSIVHCVFSVDAMFLLHYCLCFSHIVTSFFSHCCLCSSCIVTMFFLHYYFTFLALLPLLFSHCCFFLLELLPLFFLHCYLILLALLPLFFLHFCLTLLTLLIYSLSIVSLHIIVNFQVPINTILDVDLLTLLLFLFPIWFSISPLMCKLEFKHQGSNTKGEFFKVFFHFFNEHFVLFILIMC